MGSKSINPEKLRLDAIIGNNIRFQRKLHNIARDELSEIMGLTSSHLGLIERGERGTTSINMLKLSKIFNVPADYFFTPHDMHGEPENEDCDKSAAANRKKIASLLTLVDDSALKFVVDTLKGVIDITSPKSD